MTYKGLIDGIFTIAQFMIPAVVIAWADRRRPRVVRPRAPHEGDR
jgi:hypothetical protein